MVKKILVVLILIPLFVLVFAPKKELLFWAEKQWAAQGIVLADGAISENLFGVTVDHPSLYFKGAKVATIEHLSLWSLLVYSKGSADGVVFDPAFASYVAPGIGHVTLSHSIVNPLAVSLRLDDRALPGTGEIDLKQRRITLHFDTLPKKSPIKRYLKKTKGGWVYAQKF